MTLPTPPSTAHRDKENYGIIPGSRVAWSASNSYHSLQTPLKSRRNTSASALPPTKSILKKPSLLSLPTPEFQREVTPEPADPLANLSYLEYPVSKIVALNAPMKDLIEGYNVLAARLRSSLTESAKDADSSWPLFRPLRRNQEKLVDCIVRDLGRALESPENFGQEVEMYDDEECKENVDTRLSKEEGATMTSTKKKSPALSLPSPKSTPKKKKRGMSAEQVKYARDLCTTAHSVLKLLSAVFALRVVHSVFTGTFLGGLFDAVNSLLMGL